MNNDTWRTVHRTLANVSIKLVCVSYAQEGNMMYWIMFYHLYCNIHESN